MNGVERIALPEVLNVPSVSALDADLRNAAASEAQVVVIEGRDGGFCRGLDLALPGSDEARGGTALFVEALHRLRQLGKPTIALVDGAAIGGGVGLAAACDLVIATRRATFGLPELLYGFVPAIVLSVLLERLPPQKLRLAALNARTFNAEEALQAGFVDLLTADSEASLRVAVRRLSRAQPAAVRRWKTFTAPPRDAEAFEVTAGTLEDPAVAKRVQAFLAGGTAPWLQDGNE